MNKEKLPRIGAIPASVSGLRLKAAVARIRIKRGDASEIVVSANSFEHWSIGADGTLMQILPEPEVVGMVYISSDSPGTRGADSGLLSSFKGFFSGGNKPKKTAGNSQSIIQANGSTRIIVNHNGTSLDVTVAGYPQVQVVNGEIFLNDKKLDLAQCQVVRGSPSGKSGKFERGKIGSVEPLGPSNSMDEIELLVPLEFSGALAVEIGDGSFRFDFWDGGDVVVEVTGDASVDVGPISHVGCCRIVSSGDGSVELDEIRADSVVFDLSDDGDVSSQDIYCSKFSSSQRGDGNINICTLDARERSEITLSDDGSFWATKFEGGDLVTLQSGDGELTIDNLNAAAVSASITDDGCFACGEHFSAQSLTACTSGDGGFEFSEVTVEEKIACSSTDDGGFDFERVTCATYSSTHSGDGGMHIRALTTGELVLSNTDDAELMIASGSARGGSITNSGDGEISLSRSFASASLTRRNTGDGEIVFR